MNYGSQADLTIPIPGPDDVVIAVLGLTGSGKSTFISLLVDDDVPVGHSLESCTLGVTMYSFAPQGGRRVFLIDTPGFDDATRNDTEILKEFSYFMAQLYRRQVRLSGLVYLHRITDWKMAGSSLKSLSVFKKLCGEHGYRHVALTTTMWSDLQDHDVNVGSDRETQLTHTPGWWGEMQNQGSFILRHTGERSSALRVVNKLVNLRCTFVLAIQTEMVDQGKALEDTCAGQEVNKELLQLKRYLDEQIAELQTSIQHALRDRDHQHHQDLMQQQNDLEDKFFRVNQAQKELKIDLQRLTRDSDAKYRKLLAEVDGAQREVQKVIDRETIELERVKSERQQDLFRYRQQQTMYEQAKFEYERHIAALVASRKDEEVKRIKADLAHTQYMLKMAQTEFHNQQASKLAKEKQLDSQIKVLRVKKRTLLKKAAPVIGLLAGIGLMSAGLGTMMPPLIIGGASIVAAAMPKLFEKKEKKDRVGGDSEKELLENLSVIRCKSPDYPTWQA